MKKHIQKIKSTHTWDDLRLSQYCISKLKKIDSHFLNKKVLSANFELARNKNKSAGITSLFTGPNGTGKVIAAEVLANELQLDLYRIDLSNVVSKYIGETEKNLKKIFDATEDGGAILLFDEADALFGKRTDVKDSHDRYANQEVSYLLQRVENYQGLIILTTNVKSNIDQTFVRRFKTVIHFAIPKRKKKYPAKGVISSLIHKEKMLPKK